MLIYLCKYINKNKKHHPRLRVMLFSESRWRESNPRPRDYKSRALAN